MSAAQLIATLTQVIVVVVFAITFAEALRRPRRVNLDIALLFGFFAFIVVVTWLDELFGVKPGRYANAFIGSVLMTLPYLLLRLVDDFAAIPRWLLHAAEAGLVLSVVGLFLIPPPLPAGLVLLYVAYFFATEVYCAVKFVREAAASGGVTRRRLQAASLGSLFLGLVLLLAGVEQALHPVAPRLDDFWSSLAGVCGLACALGYYLGFAPPRLLRRTWQEPELRAFLGRAGSLPRLPTTDAIVDELQRGAAASLGAPHAAIILWDEESERLRVRFGPEVFERPADHLIAGRAFTTQRPQFLANAPTEEPESAEFYRNYDIQAVLAVPITAAARRLGVLCVWAARTPIFAEEDLSLARLLADQAAVILESRALIDDAARVRAREEAARLKDDFLSSAAHDLKTPLTALMAQAQLLQRRAERYPERPIDLAGLQRLSQETQRLRDRVLDLLDASRAESGRLIGAREPVDLVELAEQVCRRHTSADHPCEVRAESPVAGRFDGPRIS